MAPGPGPGPVPTTGPDRQGAAPARHNSRLRGRDDSPDACRGVEKPDSMMLEGSTDRPIGRAPGLALRPDCRNTASGPAGPAPGSCGDAMTPTPAPGPAPGPAPSPASGAVNAFAPPDAALRHEAWYGDRTVRCFARRPPHLATVLDEALARRPDGVALICENQRLSWRETRTQVDQIAAALSRRGVTAGTRVALLQGNHLAFPLFCYAAWLLDAAIVPISVREQRPGIRYILEHSGATVLVYDAALRERLPEAAELPALQHRIEVEPGQLPLVDEDPGEIPGAPANALVSTLPGDSSEAAGPAGCARDERSLAAILYSSGTTGRPKGAMLTHANVIHSTLHYQTALALVDGERCCVTVPLSHVTGLVALLAVALKQAGPLIILPQFKADAFLALAERERITFTIMVPAMYVLCLLDPDFARRDLSAWRIGGYGGAPMTPATIDRLAEILPGLKLTNCYGATETTSPVTIMPPALSRAHPDSVGLPVACADVLVMDAEGREVPPGEVGELWHKGPMVVPGYWTDPEATAANFTAGYWHSGDLGRVDDEGFVYVLDRQKDMLNRGGYKIYSVEVENVLGRHPEVVEAAVVGRPCPVLGERVHAFVTVREAGREPPPDRAALRAWCATELTDYKVPETFTIGTEELPRNANGKILKRALRQTLLAAEGPSV